MICETLHPVHLQMRVLVTDLGVPPKNASVLVTVTVLRNQYAPVFPRLVYNTSVPDTASYGAEVVVVEATDRDGQTQAGVSVGV